jgi:hypothetical protein
LTIVVKSVLESLHREEAEGLVKKNAAKRLKLSAKIRRNISANLQEQFGLKKAPRAWNNRFNDLLIKFCLVRSNADPCIYYHHQWEELTILSFFVDDGLIICSNQEKQTTSSGMEETTQQHEQIEIDEDPGPSQETDGDSIIEDPSFGFDKEIFQRW